MLTDVRLSLPDATAISSSPCNSEHASLPELSYLLLKLELLTNVDSRAETQFNCLRKTQGDCLQPTEGLDNRFSRAKQKILQEKEQKKRQEAHNANTYWAKGTGYGHSNYGKNAWDVQAYLAYQREKDCQTQEVLSGILDCINCPALSPHDMSDLADSCLVPVLESYLRNDSLLDLCKHLPLYQAILSVVKALAKHEHLRFLLASLPYQSSSLRDLLAKLYTTAAVFQQRSKLASSDSVPELSLAQEVIETFQAVQASFQSECEGDLGDSACDLGDNAADALQDYCQALQPLQFALISMKNDAGTFVHHYSSPERLMDTPSLEKTVRLAQEQGALVSSLPLNVSSTVFVRADEDRMDLMKALITGPCDTPYDSGCFEFHIFFPSNYPNCPPLVNLETTGGASVRFNPNLYNCGKVCLSLLGTWSGAEGENWNKDTSTLLQVLISVQSLIFVAQPYYNEPGYERQMGTRTGEEQSKKYNENIRLAAVEWAMLNQLRHPSPGFEKAIRTHFYLKREYVLKTVEQWLSEASPPAYSRLHALLQELREELEKLSAPELTI